MNELERRYNTQVIELRESGDPADNPKLAAAGYGSVFNAASSDLGGFTEVVAPSAFDEVLNDDVRGLFNHDPNFVLGRTTAGTLKLDVDDTGLRYEIDLPDTQTVRDLVVEPMRRGDITGSSFGFMVDEDEWIERDDGKIVRTINKVGKLLDVSPVTYPAYPDTSAAMRSLNAFKNPAAKPETMISEVRQALGLNPDADEELIYKTAIAELRLRDDQIERLTEALEIRKRIGAA